MKRRSNALINRRNYRDTRQYLTYCAEVRQNCPATVNATRTALDHLLRWATSVPFTRASEIRPIFPAYIEDLGVSLVYQEKQLQYARRFFQYGRSRWERYEDLSFDWIDSLRPAKSKGEGTVKTRELFTLDQVLKLIRLTPRTLTEERQIAGVAFLFLSGMRRRAFTTLPLCAIDWEHEPALVRQWPKLGVKTKNGKAANTYLLTHPDLEELHQVARAWYDKVQAAVGEWGMFYALLTHEPDFDPYQVPGKNRGGRLNERLHALCDRAGVPSLSPHKLRHGHAVWALQQCRTIAEYKAVSQNIMHESLTTTDAIYSGMLGQDVAGYIAGLGQS
jgi:integrase